MYIKSLKHLPQTAKKQLGENHTVILLNGLIVLLFFALTVYVKFGGSTEDHWRRAEAVVRLFTDPLTREHPFLGYLTSLSEILWTISGALCIFTFSLLQSLRPRRKPNYFILCSALIISVLLIDDLFRFTLILAMFAGIPKLFMYILYGITIISYGFFFRKILASTPYILLLVAAVLFIFSGIMDMANLAGQATPTILEDGTKLIGLVNISYYFWHVCRREVLRTLRPLSC